MTTITGIKSIDLKIEAHGHGVVNWNGPTELAPVGDVLGKMNHSLPKLRGFSNKTGKVKEDTGHQFVKNVTDIDPKINPLYIGQSCIRHHIWIDNSFDQHYLNQKNATQMLCSFAGLTRGYLIPDCGFHRTSPVLVEDFVDQLGNGNFEQMSKSGARVTEGDKAENNYFSKTTFGDTKYIGFVSISVEELQFICLDDKFGRACIKLKSKEDGNQIAVGIMETLNALNFNQYKNPQAIFHPNYVRGGSIFKQGQAGILLNDDAIQILVDNIIKRFTELSIRQAKGTMYVTNMDIDYNDGLIGKDVMRIKHGDGFANNPQRGDLCYANYYTAQ